MSYRNKYGLLRHIDEETKRIVRRECGFGCVICGNPLVTYEHFDPQFKDAKEHKPECMALLCYHHQGQTTKGLLSKQTIAEARRTPVTFVKGVGRDAFDLKSPFTLIVGDSAFENVSSIIRTCEGEEWLSIQTSEVKNGPVRLSAIFYDDAGALSLSILNNEWSPVTSQWDTEVEGTKITVRNGPGEIALELIAEPPNALKLSRLRMKKGDIGIVVEPGRVKVRRAGSEAVLEGCYFRQSETIFLV